MPPARTETPLNRHSRRLTQDDTRPAAQSMLHAAGLSRDDLARPQLGILSLGWDGNPCNMHLDGLAAEVKDAARAEGLVGLVYHAAGVSDGIAMGTPGMRYSLVSRELIADSLEMVTEAQHYDATVAVVGCDKNMPGALIGLLRVDRPGLVVYGGTIAAGCSSAGRKLDIVSSFEAVGELRAGRIAEAEFRDVVRHACPGPGACGGMYTANTMAAAIEALGMSLPGNSSLPAAADGKAAEVRRAAAAARRLLELDLRPRAVVTAAALRNAMRVVTALGGSTNAVIHLLAIARAAGVPLTLADLHALSDATPLLADLKPSGRYVMADLAGVGGVAAVMKLLLAEGLLEGDCLTVTGRTLAENLAEAPGLSPKQEIVRPLSDPIKATGHIRVLTGSLAPEGAVAKITGKEGERFRGPARCFDDEDAANAAILDGTVRPGEVVVIRYCGPRGGPGMPEMLKATSSIMGVGLGKQVALVTDGRFSGGSHGFVVGHVCPEAQAGGAIALLRDGDVVRIDAVADTIDLEVDAGELARRRAAWQAPEIPAGPGLLRKFAREVAPASQGCVTGY